MLGSIALIVGGIGAIGALLGTAGYEQTTRLNNQIKNGTNSSGFKTNSLVNYIEDSLRLGTIPNVTWNDEQQVVTATSKLQKGYDVTDLTIGERHALSRFINNAYKYDPDFQKKINNEYNSWSNEDKLKYLDSVGGNASAALIPAPAYLDGSFETYQKKVEPVKMYTNQELADLYNLDYNLDTYEKEYGQAGKAKVAYANYISDVAKTMEDTKNAENTASYLDSIRNVKSQSINSGINSGARAAAEILATKSAMDAKAQSALQTAATRNENMQAAIYENAQANLKARQAYTSLANTLATASQNLYTNDVQRYGADLLANANFYAADENLRAQRNAANTIMASAYASAQSQAANANTTSNQMDWLFRNIYLPTNNGNVNNAVRELLNDTQVQNTGATTIGRYANMYNGTNK